MNEIVNLDKIIEISNFNCREMKKVKISTFDIPYQPFIKALLKKECI